MHAEHERCSQCAPYSTHHNKKHMKRRIVISDDEEDERPDPPVAKKRAADQPAAASTARPTVPAASTAQPTVPAASTARPAAPMAPVSAEKLERSARAVVLEVSARFPEHAALLRRIAIETSSRMQSSGAKTVFDGAPPHRPRCVRLSVPILSENFSSLRDIMLHELAHCIAGREAAHGPKWRKVCLALGGTAAIGHTLSCGSGESGEGDDGRRRVQQEQPRRRGAATSRGRGSGGGGGGSSSSSSSASGRSREPSDMWGAASDALISQLIRF